MRYFLFMEKLEARDAVNQKFALFLWVGGGKAKCLFDAIKLMSVFSELRSSRPFKILDKILLLPLSHSNYFRTNF